MGGFHSLLVIFFPGLTKLFFVTRLTNRGGGGVVATPGPVNLKYKRLQRGMLIWYHGIAMGLLFPYISKKYKHPMFVVTMKSKLSILPKLRIYSEIKAKIEFFVQKVLNIGILPGFLLIKEENDVSIKYCKIQDHTKKNFVK